MKVLKKLELVLQKAKVDEDFREKLVEMRAGAVKDFGLDLSPEEEALLSSCPENQLRILIDFLAVWRL